MPLREYICRDCNYEFEEIRSADDEYKVIPCSRCEDGSAEVVFSPIGGYHINGSNSGSTRPKSAGSFKRSKE